MVFRCRYAALTKGADPFRMAAAAPAGGDLHIAVLGHDETPLVRSRMP